MILLKILILISTFCIYEFTGLMIFSSTHLFIPILRPVFQLIFCLVRLVFFFEGFPHLGYLCDIFSESLYICKYTPLALTVEYYLGWHLIIIFLSSLYVIQMKAPRPASFFPLPFMLYYFATEASMISVYSYGPILFQDMPLYCSSDQSCLKLSALFQSTFSSLFFKFLFIIF